VEGTYLTSIISDNHTKENSFSGYCKNTGQSNKDSNQSILIDTYEDHFTTTEKPIVVPPEL